ncbi:hypothetical protein AB205_0219220 [Aquarana catesbeiana]|uniref:Uncharacterized protein n=1 Tax=Aquarana catesbeiana TaxID=8400 RepID=A0A2G9R4B8_AQUCT|nr:hypothetical protein AB205_0219220 [Aquarana catesbeiana]
MLFFSSRFPLLGPLFSPMHYTPPHLSPFTDLGMLPALPARAPSAPGGGTFGRFDLCGIVFPCAHSHTHMINTVLLLTSDFKVPKRVELTTTVTTMYS